MVGASKTRVVKRRRMSARKAKAERRAAAERQTERTPDGRAAQRGPDRALWAVRGLAGIGLGLAGYLTLLHYQAGATGEIESALCGAGATVNCNLVLGSAYATLFGWPIALYAAATYAALLAGTFLATLWPTLLLCGWAFVFSVYLAALSFFGIGAVCPLCTALYVVNLGLAGCAALLGRATGSVSGAGLGFAALGFGVALAGIGLTQARDAAFVTPPQDFLAPAAEDMDAGFVRYYYEQPTVVLRGEERHVKGPADAALTLHEFVDFRCPQCAVASETLHKFQRANPDDVRLVFRHYPLDRGCNSGMQNQVHPGACAAAVAAECAGEQGKFWEYADLLFADQTRFARADFEAHAEAVRLDLDGFRACLEETRIRELVRADIAEAERIEIRATPTLVANGRLIQGVPPAGKLATLVTLVKTQTN